MFDSLTATKLKSTSLHLRGAFFLAASDAPGCVGVVRCHTAGTADTAGSSTQCPSINCWWGR